ncbi:sulfurtransferase TusA family protein [Cohnella soli]|uniref:Sulfurtransferase TusA family protein n=1 Tax=Cohnella soli TaxID=425005 RepID=A0ABW0HQM6_9BACL
MTTTFTANQVLDCKGLACPMPIVRTKKAIEALKPGEVIEMQATDKGSLADIQGWAKNTGHQYLGTLHEGEVLKHYVRKASADEEKAETMFGRTISNDELLAKLDAKEAILVLDVREPAEYGFGHIPGALSIPLGELESRAGELPKDKELFVVCRTGKRSNFACLLLEEKGYQVTNVLPGMLEWSGSREEN